MGGVPKGLLIHEGDALVFRLRRIFADLGVPTVLVGRRPEYVSTGLEIVDDDPPGIGPLGGLCALLRRAEGGVAIVVACDMPFVTTDLVARLLDAPAAAAVAPRLDGRWEPMLARYDAHAALPIALRRARDRETSLQGLLDELGAEPLPLLAGEERALVDWDEPREMIR
jgi:molybdopterin-guanine dinucleotide biosynthesis protein A